MPAAPSSSDDTSPLRLLIVEDDPDLGSSLHEFFSKRAYDVSRTENGEAALDEMTALPPYDVVLLDVMLPEKDGFEVLRDARRAGVDSPVIVLTAKSENKHKLRGFDLGADDYVTKPFDPKELAARVQAVYERSDLPPPQVGDSYTFGDVTVDLTDQTATRNGEQIKFTDLEFDILTYFINHRGRTVSRKQLLRDVWGISGDITTRTIDRHVAALRKKIEPDPKDPSFIQTVYGIGYKFVG
jgi:DNA-binding response OmpR family regulator